MWRAPIVCGAIIRTLSPTSVIDVGCAIGDYVQGYLNLGIAAMGIEGSKAAERYLACDRAHVLFADLRKPIKILKRWDVATCWDVAEHIEAAAADTFVANLCSFSDTVVMSAAHPGCEGRHHVNCQPASYWIRKFAALRYERHVPIEDAIKRCLEPYKNKKGIRNYYHSMLVFRRRT